MKGLIATAVVALIGYGVSKSVNNSNTELGESTLSNIEALASGETNIRSCLAAWGQCIGNTKAPYVEVSF